MSLQKAGSRSVVAAERRPALPAYWALSSAEVVSDLESDGAGLSDAEAAKRLALYGPNRLMPRRRSGVLHELMRQFTQPIVLILIAATGLSPPMKMKLIT